MDTRKRIGLASLGVVIVLAIAVFFWKQGPDVPPPPAPTLGTQPLPTATSSTAAAPDAMILRNVVKGFEIRHPAPIDTDDLGAGDLHIAKDTWMSARILPDSYQWTDDKSCPKTPFLDGRAVEANRTSVGNIPFCVSHVSEGAAGSVYEDYEYVTKAHTGYVALHFVYRHVSDVRIYEGCETNADLQKEECKALQWNEDRDTALFKEILKTYRVIQPGS